MLIGSSLGAWLSILATLERLDRVKGLLLIAPAVDFFRPRFESFPEEARTQLIHGETLWFEGPFGKFPVNYRIVEESIPLELLCREGPLPIHCPIRILHGMNDEQAPYKVGIQLAEKFASEDVEILLRKAGGDHRMSTESDLNLLQQSIESLLAAVAVERTISVPAPSL